MATVLAVSMSTALLVAAVSTATAAPESLTIDAPDAPTAGTVELTGSVGLAEGEVTTVLYVLDATNSTASPAGADCSGNGAQGAEDDLNSDGSVGDPLDCEIAGVGSLNRSLAATTGLQVGLVAFANEAATAIVDPAGEATFVPPGYTGGDPRPRIDTVARSVVRNEIGLFDSKSLGGSGSGTAFNNAIREALSTLGDAPAGPKWIMFLSDGQSAVGDAMLSQLTQSGVRLRTFGIGEDATCAPSGSLFKMASATGESCVQTLDPASLTERITGSQPDAVNGVTVSIDDVSVAAVLDAVGGWSASFTLGAGTRTATARAVLASGSTITASRMFTVAPAPGGPPPGTTSPGPGALRATVVTVTRPKPMRAVLPRRVVGRVGRASSGASVASGLAGSRVLLQARPVAGAPWTTVDRDKADRAGKFVLTWEPKVRLRHLRVVLLPYKRWAASAAAVPSAEISACKVVKRSGDWSVTCRTTALAGSRVRLLDHGDITDRARVRSGSFRLDGTGRVTGHSIDIKGTQGHHVRLAL